MMGTRHRRVLYAWEWGAGSGHVQRFLPIAEALSQRGDEVVWVVKDKVRLANTPSVSSDRTLACPALSRCPRARSIPPRNLAAIAWNLGFHGGDTLGSVVRQWCQILTRVRPDCVVQDFGLVAGMVARSLGIPTVRIGTGYTCPPRSETPIDLPGFTEDEAGNPSTRPIQGKSTELVYENIMDLIAMAFRASALSVPSCWSDVVNGCEEDILATLPLLDPYAHHRTPPRWDGVWDSLAKDCQGDDALPERLQADVLAYLKPMEHWGRFFDALKQCGVRVDLVPDHVPDELLRQCDPEWVRVCEGFRCIASAAKRGMTLINNGNHGSTAMALLNGMPVIACPLYFEQRLTAKAIARAGVGRNIDIRRPDSFDETLSAEWAGEASRSRVKRFQKRHASVFLVGHERLLARFDR